MNATWELTRLSGGKWSHANGSLLLNIRLMVRSNDLNQDWGKNASLKLQGGKMRKFLPHLQIRILLFCAANLKCELYQVDLKKALLHGDLEEEVYMVVQFKTIS